MVWRDRVRELDLDTVGTLGRLDKEFKIMIYMLRVRAEKVDSMRNRRVI